MADIKDNKRSILEAYLNTKKIFEDDAAAPADSTQTTGSDKPADKPANSETTESPSNNTSGTSSKISSDPSNSKGLGSYVSLKSKFTADCDYGGDLKDAANNRFDAKGKVLKTCFNLGPSKATISYGDVEIIDGESADKSIESPKSGSESKSGSEDSNKKESYSYSIMESYLNLNKSLFIEEDSNSSDNSANNSQSNTDNASYVSLQFKVGIENEGYTVWTVAVDTRANLESVKKAILSKKFKNAYDIASNGLGADGLIPLIAHTFVNAEQHPPFIGHCRYGFGSGEEGNSKEGSNTSGYTLALAVAPIDGKTNRTSDDLAAQVIYNITDIDGITGGKLGETLAAIKKYAKDKVSGDNSSNYSHRSKETDQHVVDAINEYIKNSFEEVGDQEMYADFKKIRDGYLKKCLDEKMIELQSETKLDENSSKFNTSDKLIYY